MFYVSLYGHLHSSGKGFEDTLYLVMLVSALGLDVEVHTSAVRQALEEMQEHFGWHLANFLSLELCIPYEPGATAEIETYLTQTVVHGKAISIALYATFVANCLSKAFAQGQSGILDRMMLVDVKVAIAGDVEVYVTMTRYLFEHVVKETKTGADVALAVAI